MFNLILLVLGDLAVIVLQGFYMGVGIRQSSGLIHILGLTLPSLLVWLVLAAALQIYRGINQFGKSLADPLALDERTESRLWQLIQLQRPIRVGIVWLSVSLFAVFWQTFYWQYILRQNRGISVRFTFYFCLAGLFFLAFWRLVWTVFVLVRILAKSHPVLRVFSYLVVFSAVLFQLPALAITLQVRSQKIDLVDYNRNDYPIAIVFGAGVYRNGTASSVLCDRVETAVRLYQKGAVERLLMSGDNSAASRHETAVMAALANNMGVPQEAIVQDETGLSTSATCENAVNRFGIKKAVLVTQSFHTSRALYSCKRVGMDALAVASDNSVYNIFSWLMWLARDWTGLTFTWLADFL
ncbi:MAG: YdcF family protein [Chloroflexi bacterium]|nr:YdcF family protein [Chloroflexota bacterium]